MTDQERIDVQELLDSLPRCYTYGGEGPNGLSERCEEVAVMAHPTAVNGDWTLKCARHPSGPENEWGATAMPTCWAAVVARLVAQGFRSTRSRT
jgi:hypothetical protein